MTFDYTPDRCTALELVNTNKICSIAGALNHRQGLPLEPGVLASLLALQNEGYLDRYLPRPGTGNHKQWPVHLGVRGIDLLAGFITNIRNDSLG